MKLEDRCIKCGPDWDRCRCWADGLRAELALSKEHVKLLRAAIDDIVHDHCPCCGDSHRPSDEELESNKRLNAAMDATEQQP